MSKRGRMQVKEHVSIRPVVDAMIAMYERWYIGAVDDSTLRVVLKLFAEGMNEQDGTEKEYCSNCKKIGWFWHNNIKTAMQEKKNKREAEEDEDVDE